MPDLDEAKLKRIEEWHRVRAENWAADSMMKDRYRQVQEFAAALRQAWRERDEARAKLPWTEPEVRLSKEVGTVRSELFKMIERAERAEAEVERLTEELKRYKGPGMVGKWRQRWGIFAVPSTPPRSSHE